MGKPDFFENLSKKLFLFISHKKNCRVFFKKNIFFHHIFQFSKKSVFPILQSFYVKYVLIFEKYF